MTAFRRHKEAVTEPLPGSVESGLIVPLAPFSLDLVHDVFMVIEEPENPLQFPVEMLTATAPPLTIGQFYEAIKRKIVEEGEKIFTGDPTRQLTYGFPPDELFAITGVESAVHAIDLIVRQGEETTESPLDPEGELAHYYKYAEIWNGRILEPNPNAPPDAPEDQTYIYKGPLIPFDPNGVQPMITNPKRTSYKPGSAARYACENFNYGFTSLLKSLQSTFNGRPDDLGASIGLMESLKEQAMDLATINIGDGMTAGPSCEYQPTNP